MNGKSQAGFTLVEVIVSVVILSIGTLVLASGSLFATRDLTRSRLQSVAGSMAQAKLDELRTRAASTSPACTAAAFTNSPSAVIANGVTMTWEVPASGANRTLRVITSYSYGAGRIKADTVAGSVAC